MQCEFITIVRSSSQPSGYTGHQMLDDVGLIHRNGRLYDPFLGRICAAAPFVQSPNNIQRNALKGFSTVMPK